MAVTGGAAPYLIVIAVLLLVVAVLVRTRRCDGDAALPVLGHLHLLKRPPLRRSLRRRGQGAGGVAAAGPRGGRCSRRRRTRRHGGALHGVRRRDGGEAPGCSPGMSSVCKFFQGNHQYILENPNNCTFEEERFAHLSHGMDSSTCLISLGELNAVALPLKKGAGFELIIQQDLHY
uniref:Uncharacterized protein n=1 Tax=Oryza meridionalis TaxID=40149 RepID=A0A0E0F798_9ORYZ